MARAKTKRARGSAASRQGSAGQALGSAFAQEATGVVLLAVALFAALAVWSHDPVDSAFGADPVLNRGGRLGALVLRGAGGEHRPGLRRLRAGLRGPGRAPAAGARPALPQLAAGAGTPPAAAAGGDDPAPARDRPAAAGRVSRRRPGPLAGGPGELAAGILGGSAPQRRRPGPRGSRALARLPGTGPGPGGPSRSAPRRPRRPACFSSAIGGLVGSARALQRGALELGHGVERGWQNLGVWREQRARRARAAASEREAVAEGELPPAAPARKRPPERDRRSSTITRSARPAAPARPASTSSRRLRGAPTSSPRWTSSRRPRAASAATTATA